MNLSLLSWKTTAAIAVTSLLTACSQAPRTVDASVPLVTQNQDIDGQVIPEQYWSALAQKHVRQLKHNKYDVQVGPLYVSSLGNNCRILQLKEESTGEEQSRVACQKNQEPSESAPWVLTKSIIVQYAPVSWE